jgi:5,10-methylenetetrahydromethanopterin reductase
LTAKAKPIALGALIAGKQTAAELRRTVRDCEAWGYDYFWHADERFFRDVYAALALCGLETSRMQLGVGVTDPYSRHPALTAMGIATVDEISNGRAVLGIGAGVAGFAEMGIEIRKPAKAIREAIALIRQLLTNQPVTVEGELFRFDNGILSVPGRTDLPIYIAGKGPLNIQLAGEIADGLIISSCVADVTIDETRALLAKGAAKSGRSPDAVALVSRVNVSISDDGDWAREAVKPMLAALLVSKKPDFSFLDPLGLRMSSKLAEAVAGARYGLDNVEMLRVTELIPDEFTAALAVAGTPAEVARIIARMVRRGVTQVMAYPMPAPGDNPSDVLRRLALDVRPLVEAELSGVRAGATAASA